MQEAITLMHRNQTMRGMRHWPDANGETQDSVPAVILLHSFTSQKGEWHQMYVKLSRALERANVASFRFDFLGSGESDGEFIDMTVSHEVEEAHAILDMVREHPGVDPARVSLVGFSLGGLVAALVAGDCQDKVEKLALIAPAWNMRDWVVQMASGMSEAAMDRGFDHNANLVGRPFAEDILPLEPFSRAAKFEGPVLTVYGEADARVPADVIMRSSRQAYGDRTLLHKIAEANHTFDKYEWERDVLAAVVSFLT